MTMQDVLFLREISKLCTSLGVPWPNYQACEAGLESTFGRSELALKYNNLYGQKQPSHPVFQTVKLYTREFIDGQWIEVPADWIVFPSRADCIKFRWSHLVQMSRAQVWEDGKLTPRYAGYADAMTATTGEEFIKAVSQNWSTDPERGQKVLDVYKQWAQLEGWDKGNVVSPVQPPSGPTLPIPEGLK